MIEYNCVLKLIELGVAVVNEVLLLDLMPTFVPNEQAVDGFILRTLVGRDAVDELRLSVEHHLKEANRLAALDGDREGQFEGEQILIFS